MKFEWINLITSPYILMFLAIATGLLFGKVKFGRFNFGVSGALFTGLIIGWGIYRFGNHIVAQGADAEGYTAASKMIDAGIISSGFFKLSLIFFVAAVGLLAAKDMGAVLKKYGAKFVVLGVIITFVGAGTTYVATCGANLLGLNSNVYEVAGVYTGALTSSPGLGAALETAKDHAEEFIADYSEMPNESNDQVLKVMDPSGALTHENTPEVTEEQVKTYVANAEASVGIGHAIGYPFGVIIVIFAVNFFHRIFRMDVNEEKKRFALEMDEARKSVKTKDIPDGPFNLIAFSITCVVGYILGSIQINLGPLGYFSLGSTGGVLITGLLLGYMGKIGPVSFRMEPKSLTLIREIGLAFFLAIIGLRYGYKVFDALLGSGVYLALVSLAVGILAMLVGFLIGRYVFKLNWIMLAGAICGGMTSTPGLGAAIDALESDDPAAGY
ncbi:MAG: hypothetical protein MJA31_14265, partial [Clostridia bacterium]|nr:hypothetical protein [Clostridia bacterium]